MLRIRMNTHQEKTFQDFIQHCKVKKLYQRSIEIYGKFYGKFEEWMNGKQIIQTIINTGIHLWRNVYVKQFILNGGSEFAL